MFDGKQTVAKTLGPGHGQRPMITGVQIRAGRALLGWSPGELAKRSGLSYASVRRAEGTDGIPTLSSPNLFAIERVLREAGVVFLDEGEMRPGGRGVRLRV